MKVIIVGLGRVGKTLVSELIKEEHDLVVLDIDADVVQEIVNKRDVQGICGNGCIVENLKEAGVKNCDVLISVTPHDENNILCCMIARSLGAKHVIARVRDPQYFDQLEFMQKSLGISMLFNPEEAVSHEIVRILRFPAAVKVSSFSGGKVDVIEFKILEGSPLDGISLMDFRKKSKYPVLIVAVEHEGKIAIPDGSYILHKGDTISVCAKHNEVRGVFRSVSLLKHKAESVMILGGGREAFYLARELDDNGIFVKVITDSLDRCMTIKGELDKAEVIKGDYTNREILESEGISDMDAVVCMSPYDENNIVTALFAKGMGVDKTISVLHGDSYYDLLDSIQLDTAISPFRLAAANIARYLRAINVDEQSQIRAMYKIANEKAEALLFRVREQEKLVGKSLKELNVKKGVLIAAVVRGKAAYIPDGNFVIENNDDILIISTGSKINRLEEIVA